jgi:hypothetical protein
VRKAKRKWVGAKGSEHGEKRERGLHTGSLPKAACGGGACGGRRVILRRNLALSHDLSAHVSFVSRRPIVFQRILPLFLVFCSSWTTVVSISQLRQGASALLFAPSSFLLPASCRKRRQSHFLPCTSFPFRPTTAYLVKRFPISQ